jgi:predicted RecB family nuclease
MPTKKPRTIITLPYEVNDTFERMAKISGKPKASVITAWLVDIHPVLKDSVRTVEAIMADKENQEKLLDQYLREQTVSAASNLSLLTQMGLDGFEPFRKK